jgi:hypothetical protein
MRLRQPATVVVLVALVLQALLLLVSAREASLPAGDALGYLAAVAIDPVLLLLLTALLVTCRLGEPTRAARGLTLAALVLTALLFAAAVGLAVAAMVAMPWPDGDETEFYRWLLPSLTVAVLSLAVQVALLRRPVARSATTPEIEPIRSEVRSESESEPEPDPELQPTWTEDQAVGTVWRRAGDASPQTAATDWDASGETGGWWGPAREREPGPDQRGRTEL